MKNNIILALCIFPLVLFSQTKYKIFKVEGTVQQFSSVKNQWFPLKTKDEITGETKIKCFSNSVIIFCDTAYHVFELKKQGEFLVKNLLGTAQVNTSVEMQKAVKFFVEQTFSSGNKGNTQKSKGVVYRGHEKEILFPFDSMVVLEDSVPFVIKLEKDNYPVSVTLYSADQVLFHLVLSHDTAFTLPSSVFSFLKWNQLLVGKNHFHFLCQKIINPHVFDYMNTLVPVDKLQNSVYYVLAIDYCFAQGYFNTARLLIARIQQKEFEEVVSLSGDPRIEKLKEINSFIREKN